MARNIGATLSLNNGNFFTNMKSAVNASNNLKKSLGSATGGLKSFSSQSGSTGNVITSLASKAALAVGAFVSIRSAVNFGRDVINTGMEFEQGMANVSAISGATGAELAALSEKAKQMGATTKFSAIEASEAMSYMAMAGWNSSQMIDGIGGIMNLAAASGEDLARVSDIVTDSLTAFGLKASDSSEFADILAVASSSANTNVSMLGESFKNVAPVAGAMGYSVRDTTVALSLMANAGIKGSDAGTSLRSVMTRLAKPTADVSKALTALNIEVTATDGSMKPLSQLIPELQTKFAGLTESERGQYATMIAGKNAMSGFLSIVNSSTEDFNSLTAAINDSDGAAQKMADTMNDTVQGKLTLLKSQFEGVKIAIFDALGSSQFKDVLQMASDALGKLTPYITTITVAIGNGLFAAIKGVYDLAVTVIHTISPSIEHLKSAFGSVQSAFDEAMGNTSAMTSITNLISGLAGLVVDTAASIMEALAPILPDVMEIIGTIAGMLNEVIPPIGRLITTTIKAVAPLLKPIVKIISSIVDVLSRVLVPVITFVADVVGGVIGVISNLLGGVLNTISGICEGIASIFGNVFDSAKSVVEDKLGNIQKAYEENGGGIKGVAAGAIEAVKGYYTAGFDFINNLTGGRLGELVDGVKQKLSPLINAVKEKLSLLKDAVGEKLGAFKDAVVKAFAPVGEAISSILGGIRDTISNIVNGVRENFLKFTQSIQQAFQGVWSGITTAFEGIKNVISGAFQVIVGIFTGNTETIKNGIQSVKDGFYSAVEGIRTVAENVWNAIVAGVTFAFESVRTVVTNVISGVKNQITTIRTTVSNIFTSVWTTISQTFENVKSKVVSVFENVKSTIRNAIETIKGFFHFEWSLPKIKLPHFKMTGSFSLNPPSVPSFGVEWYKQGGIMTRPTMFGINGGNAMVGGEAGAEAILPLTQFRNNLRDYLRPQTVPAGKPNVTNYIDIKIYSDGDDDETLANKVANKIVEVIENM